MTAAPAMSLRVRLFLLILLPLIAVSVLLGIWRFEVAQGTSEELFDRSLLAAALAISRDVAISEGDAISPGTRALISNAGGGEIFYHVTGPGGIYITGYAYPPSPGVGAVREDPAYFMARYRDETVRVLRMSEITTIGDMTGRTIVTVWQRTSDRDAFAAALARRAAGLLAALIVALGIVVWFGVELGLRPLRGLRDAIEQRSPDDLSRIQRPVPVEVAGIVATLNRLFGQVDSSIQTHQAFISDAAHQLRNPASAVLSLAETLPDVRDPVEKHQREQELIGAARNAARLATQLLSLERLRYDMQLDFELTDLNAVTERSCAELGSGILSRDLHFEFDPASDGVPVQGDPVLLGEAVTNLVDNAVQHGGAGLTTIVVQVRVHGRDAILTVEDDGQGLPPESADLAFRRFGQLSPGDGSGLGLSIVQEIAKRHGGDVSLLPVDKGTCVRLRLPSAEGASVAPAPVA